jgi:hypothetical protein
VKFESEVVSFSVHCLMTWYVYISSHNCVGNIIVVVLLVLVKICHIMTQRCFMLCTTYTNFWYIICRCGRMVVEFTTTCAIVAYHHLSCEFEPHSWWGALDTLCDKVCLWLAAGQWQTLSHKVIVLLILMEFMIITVYKLSFHINQWKELVCWK